MRFGFTFRSARNGTRHWLIPSGVDRHARRPWRSTHGSGETTAIDATPQPEGQEQQEDRLHGDLGELLNAIRVALPGVQVLFAFLIAVPFSNRFGKVTTVERDAYLAALLCAGIASILLIAPSAHHRLRWRLPVEENALVWGNRLLVVGTLFLALAMIGAVFFVTEVLLGGSGAVAITVVLATACGLIWYALPLSWRSGKAPKSTPLD
jgi:hypothetical protein